MMRNTGLYSPFTPSGKLVVDGVVVSSYMAFGDSEKLAVLDGHIAALWQWMAHTFQASHRLVCHHLSKCLSEEYDSNGLSTWNARSFLRGRMAIAAGRISLEHSTARVDSPATDVGSIGDYGADAAWCARRHFHLLLSQEEPSLDGYMSRRASPQNDLCITSHCPDSPARS